MSYLTGDPLQVRIRIAFGASIAADPATWTWTDVTQWWHVPDDVRIGWGRSSGAEQPETSTLSLTLKNPDRRFTAYDPRSPYWPNVRKWTPIEYDIDLGDGAGWRNRFSGFIRRWPLTWPGASPLMALAKIDAVGVLGRLGRGKPPDRSALRRTITASGALAYWPAEDGTDASVAGSAIAGHPPLAMTGVAEFRTLEEWLTRGYTVRYGTTALADLAAGGRLQATVPTTVAAATATGWTVAVAADIVDQDGLSADLVLAEVATPGGTFVRWRLVITKTARTQVIAYDSTGAATLVVEYGSVVISLFTHNFSVWQNGANISAGYVWDSVDGYWAAGSVAGTLTGVTSVAVNPTGVTNVAPMPVGHIAVWAGRQLPVANYRDGGMVLALFGYAWTGFGTANNTATGEPATTRLARLVAEDSLTLDMPAVDPADEMLMGWQPPGTSLALYQECESTDQGLIYESGFGLGYLPRSLRYNAPVALTIDGDLRQLGMPFEPVDDDQMLRNLWTVEREGGSSAVAADLESIDVQGEIEGSAKVNLAGDDPLPDHAGWRLRQSTAQEPRYPAVSINLAAHPELAAAWCACKPGSRIQVVNPPEQNVPGVVDQLVVGATETYRGRRSWRATLNVVPASPWDVATVDGTQRVAADGSTLASALTSGGTSLLLASTAANGPWTQDPADMPLAVRAGGERVTVSAIAPAVTDTFTRSLSGWGTADSGQAWTTSGGSAGDYTVDTARGVMSQGTVGVLRTAVLDVGATDVTFAVDIPLVPTPTGAPNTYWLFARYIDANNHYLARLDVAPGATTQLALFKRGGGTLTGLGASVALSPNIGGTWRVVLDVHGSALLLAKAWRVGTDSDPGWLLSATDGGVLATAGGTRVGVGARLETGNTSTLPVLARFDNALVSNPQTVTLSGRAVNGVTRAWPSGTPVDVWQPAIAAL